MTEHQPIDSESWMTLSGQRLLRRHPGVRKPMSSPEGNGPPT